MVDGASEQEQEHEEARQAQQGFGDRGADVRAVPHRSVAEERQRWSGRKPEDLPRAVEEKLLAMMDRLELNYGAADLILTPDGDYVFLEINPCGEFCWLDKLTSLPLGDAMAALLLNGHALAA